jgi:hypothetical protein
MTPVCRGLLITIRQPQDSNILSKIDKITNNHSKTSNRITRDSISRITNPREDQILIVVPAIILSQTTIVRLTDPTAAAISIETTTFKGDLIAIPSTKISVK